MEPQDYPILHFEQMARLARIVKDLPAQILEHDYSGESFGSWRVLLRYKGRVIEVSFDGREGSTVLRRSADRKPPYTFGSVQSVGSGELMRELDDTAIEQICGAIRT